MVKIRNLPDGCAGVHFQNVKVAQTIGLFRLQTAVNAVACKHGGSDYKMIFYVGKRIAREHTGSLQMDKCILFAVGDNSFHIACFDCRIKGIFHGWRSVKGLKFTAF